MRPMEARAPIEIRPIDPDDLDALVEIEAAYLARHEARTSIDAASVRHYARSGHAFTARSAGLVVGAVLAQAVWDGTRPVVRAARVMAQGDDAEVLQRLLEALVKSAYDAAVYDLSVDLPSSDAAASAALTATSFAERPVRRFERVLGSRSALGT